MGTQADRHIDKRNIGNSRGGGVRTETWAHRDTLTDRTQGMSGRGEEGKKRVRLLQNKISEQLTQIA